MCRNIQIFTDTGVATKKGKEAMNVREQGDAREERNGGKASFKKEAVLRVLC